MKSKEVKRLISSIEEDYSCTLDLDPSDYVFMMNDKDKIYYANKEVFSLDIKSYAMGIYFGTITKSGIRPSMELAQLIIKNAKKNIVSIDEEQAKAWMKGEDLSIELLGVESGLVIIKFGVNALSSSLYKDGYLLNYVPKQRRIDMI